MNIKKIKEISLELEKISKDYTDSGYKGIIITMKEKDYKAVFTDMRVNEESREKLKNKFKNLEFYNLQQYDDEDEVEMTISKVYGMINFFGTAILDKDLPIDKKEKLENIEYGLFGEIENME